MSHAVITWGRFNPPTEVGHGKLVKKVQDQAEKVGGDHYVFPTHTEDKKKNPLSHGEKVSAMRSLFPNANVVSNSKVRTIIDAMKHLEGKGHKEVTVVAGSDRVDEYHGLLNKYREKEFPGIKKVNVVSAGQRDPDAEGAEGMSASKLRGLVSAGKRDEFISHYSDPKLGARIHDKVKAGMQLESVAPVGIFLLGGPGSGKDYVLTHIFSRFDLTEVQADHILNGAADELIRENKNIVINGVSDLDKIQVINALLEGYNIDYVYVSVTNKVSRMRNSLREQPLAETKRTEKWLRAEQLAEGLDCFAFNNSINLNESSELEKVFFANQIEKLLERLTNHGLELTQNPEPKTFVLVREKYMPEKYKTGNKKTDAARAAHWKKMSKYSDRDPRAYKDAPGDKKARKEGIPLSKHTIAIRKAMGEEKAIDETIRKVEGGYRLVSKKTGRNLGTYPTKAGAEKRERQVQYFKHLGEENLEEAADKSLSAKAKKFGVSLSTLRKVYRRGVAAWNSGHRPGTTPSQWGHARVNSYLNKGKTYYTADKDLREETENLDQLFEMQLVGTDEYRKHAIAMTPGQNQEIEDVTKAMGMDVSSKGKGCDCPDESDCNCDEPLREGSGKSFRALRAEAKETKEEPTVDVTPTLKKTKGSNRVSVPGRLVNPAADGLPVTSRMTGESVEATLGTIKQTAKQGAKAVGRGAVTALNVASLPSFYNYAKQTIGDIGAAAKRDPKETLKSAGGNQRFDAMARSMSKPLKTPSEKDVETVIKKKLVKFGKSYDAPDPLSAAIDKAFEEVNPDKLNEAIQYHLTENISFTENVFRPGSQMFFAMLKEAKRLYKEGKYEPKDEYEKDLLESDVGEFASYEGTMIPLDFPFEDESLQEEDKTNGKGIGKPWREGSGGAVYVRDGDSIRKIRFSQSGMKKKYMDPGATRSFVARHHCLTNKDKTSASYWACRWPRYFSNSGKVWW